MIALVGSCSFYDSLTDRRLVCLGNPTEKAFITPTPGNFTLVCADDEGRSAEVKVTKRNQ
jgi:hypothetical protein